MMETESRPVHPLPRALKLRMARPDARRSTEESSRSSSTLMTNYYPVIARGIAGLNDNSAESRRALYERVLTALVEQLRELDPPLEEPEILRERLSLADAVRRVEADAAVPAAGDRFGESKPARRTFARTRAAGFDGSSVATGIEAPNLVPEGQGSAPRGLRWPAQPRPPADAPRRGGRFIHLVALITAWLAVLATVALGWALYWQRDQVKAWFGASPVAEWQRVIDPPRPKIADRVGPGQQTGQAVSVESASLYEEDPVDQQGKRYAGSVAWKAEMMSPEGKPPELVIRASLEIPERHMRMTVSLRRNPDKTLPASHTIEIASQSPADFGEISSIPALLMKSGEQTNGSRLAGATAKVTSGLFLVGLSATESDMQRNLQMLKEQPWFDIPLIYENGRRAILAFEKGAAGERAFQEAFSVWRD